MILDSFRMERCVEWRERRDGEVGRGVLFEWGVCLGRLGAKGFGEAIGACDS